MNWLYIAWRNLGLKKLQTALSLVLLAFGVGLVSLLMLTEKQLTDTFDRNIRDIDLVLGAKGSPLQLILANVYHVDAPTGNIRLADAEKVMNHPYIASGIPLAYGDNYRGFRIVGSTLDYTEHYAAKWAEGRPFENAFEVVVGARVAETTGLRVGDEFFSAHGLQDETDVHTDKTFYVVGVLEESGAVLDQLLLCNIETIWGVHEGHGEVVAPEDREITAVLLKKRNPLAVLTIPNTIRETNMQVALPSIEINRLTQNFGIGMGTLRAIALLIMCISFASIFISVYDNLLARRYELALMRTMGGSRGGLFWLLLLEGGLLSVGGAALGLFLSRLGLIALAQLIENKFRYDWGSLAVLPNEWVLAGMAIFVGLIAAAIPGISAMKLDTSRTLSESA
jgi:putative ABC transport system permease protein